MTDELELNGSSVRQEGRWQVTEEEQRSNLRYTNLNKIEINNRKLATVTSGYLQTVNRAGIKREFHSYC
jgi:hypothetical protein